MSHPNQQNGPQPLGPIAVGALAIQVGILVANLYFALEWIQVAAAIPLVNFAQILAGSYLFVGTLVRHRGAWQLGLIQSGLLVATGWMTAASIVFVDHPFAAGGFVLGCLNAAYFLLMVTPQMRRHFDLCCPYCHQFSERPADALFQSVHCSHCNLTWKRSWELLPAEKLALAAQPAAQKQVAVKPNDSQNIRPVTPYAEF